MHSKGEGFTFEHAKYFLSNYIIFLNADSSTLLLLRDPVKGKIIGKWKILLRFELKKSPSDLYRKEEMASPFLGFNILYNFNWKHEAKLRKTRLQKIYYQFSLILNYNENFKFICYGQVGFIYENLFFVARFEYIRQALPNLTRIPR